jgi:hypothetical protein
MWGQSAASTSQAEATPANQFSMVRAVRLSTVKVIGKLVADPVR